MQTENNVCAIVAWLNYLFVCRDRSNCLYVACYILQGARKLRVFTTPNYWRIASPASARKTCVRLDFQYNHRQLTIKWLSARHSKFALLDAILIRYRCLTTVVVFELWLLPAAISTPLDTCCNYGNGGRETLHLQHRGSAISALHGRRVRVFGRCPGTHLRKVVCRPVFCFVLPNGRIRICWRRCRSIG